MVDPDELTRRQLAVQRTSERPRLEAEVPRLDRSAHHEVAPGGEDRPEPRFDRARVDPETAGVQIDRRLATSPGLGRGAGSDPVRACRAAVAVDRLPERCEGFEELTPSTRIGLGRQPPEHVEPVGRLTADADRLRRRAVGGGRARRQHRQPVPREDHVGRSVVAFGRRLLDRHRVGRIARCQPPQGVAHRRLSPTVLGIEPGRREGVQRGHRGCDRAGRHAI